MNKSVPANHGPILATHLLPRRRWSFMISEKITHTLGLEKPLVDWRAEHQLVQQFFETSKMHYYFLRHMETPSPIWFEQRLKKRIPNINIWESQSFNYVISSGAYALYKFQPRSYSRNGWPHKATFRSADFNDAFSGWDGGPRSTPITGIKRFHMMPQESYWSSNTMNSRRPSWCTKPILRM